jgi:hypothetical protein
VKRSLLFPCVRVCVCYVETLSEICGDFGLAAVEIAFQNIYDAAMDFLHEKALCQGQENNEEESENADRDNVVLDAVADLIAAVLFPRTHTHTRIHTRAYTDTKNITPFCHTYMYEADVHTRTHVAIFLIYSSYQYIASRRFAFDTECCFDFGSCLFNF